MSDNELHYTARFRRSIQPAQYETAEAEVTVSGRIAEGQSVVAVAAASLDKVTGVVLARLTQVKVGTNTPTATTTTVEPSTPAAPAAEPEKRGPGRPPKKAEAPTTATEVAEKFEAEAPKTEPSATKLAGANVEPEIAEKDLPPVTDAELQTECSKAAKVIKPEGVKALFKNFKINRTSELDVAMRRPFIKDLRAAVAKKQAEDKKPAASDDIED